MAGECPAYRVISACEFGLFGKRQTNSVLTPSASAQSDSVIRPFVIGRKNWLFSNSVRGVKASANLYSLIETAKANGLEPYAYLRYLFAELPKAETVDAIDALLPGNLNKDQIKIQ